MKELFFSPAFALVRFIFGYGVGACIALIICYKKILPWMDKREQIKEEKERQEKEQEIKNLFENYSVDSAQDWIRIDDNTIRSFTTGITLHLKKD